MTRARLEVCFNIFKVCHDIKFRDNNTRQESYVATKKVVCNDNHNKMLREQWRDIELYCYDKSFRELQKECRDKEKLCRDIN